MATRSTYITVRIDIDNPNKDEITDDDVQEVVSDAEYHFGNVGEFTLETEICGINDEF